MMGFLKKQWPLIGISLLVVVVFFYLWGSRKGAGKSLRVTDVFPEEGFKLEDIHYTQEDPEEGIKWFLEAKEARISSDRQHISFKHFRLKLEPENRPSIDIEGERGEWDKGSGQILLRENLKGWTGNGYRIVTDQIVYQQEEGYLKSDLPVRMTGPSFSVEGRGLYVDLKREFLSLGAEVTTVVNKGAFTL